MFISVINNIVQMVMTRLHDHQWQQVGVGRIYEIGIQLQTIQLASSFLVTENFL